VVWKEGVDAVSARSIISSLFQQVAAEQGKRLSPLDDDLSLLESGLDSLCFAIIVARLEDELGVDPFTASDEVYFPITFGDFVKLYEPLPD
jgi:hypothetical protein